MGRRPGLAARFAAVTHAADRAALVDGFSVGLMLVSAALLFDNRTLLLDALLGAVR